MKMFKDLAKEIKKSLNVVSCEVSENLITISVKFLIKQSNELLTLFVVKNIEGKYLLTDLALTLEDLGEDEKYEKFIGLTVGDFGLQFDGRCIYTEVTLENVCLKIEDFVKIAKVLL